MDVPKLFNRKKQTNVSEKRFYLALFITDVTVQAGLWCIEDGSFTVLSVSDAKAYDSQSVNSLLHTADQVLQELGPDSEKTDEVVFGFDFDWVDAEGIKSEKKSIIKSLSKDLSLQPVGFVVIPEALIHTYQKSDPNCSLILVQVHPHQVVVTIVQQGTILSSEKVGKSETVLSDVIEALARFNQVGTSQTLPGKMMLAGIGVSTEVSRTLQQELLAHDWSTHFSFVHTPVIEVIPEQNSIQSVLEESGKAIAHAQGISVNESSNLNNTSEHDVTSYPEQKDAGLAASNLALNKEIATSHENMQMKQDVLPFLKKSNDQEVLNTKKDHKQHFSWNPLDWWKKQPVIILTAVIAGLVCLGVFGVIASSINRSAIIEVVTDTKYLSKDVTVTLDPTLSQSDFDALQLKATQVSTTVSGSDSIAASGVKLVGEKARGKITIFNKTDAVKSFPSGTIVSSGVMQFELLDSVEVASASTKMSSAESETRVFGKATVEVQAREIGAQFNIAKETELQVADFAVSTYAAQADEDFSGGSSREVRVVSAKDRSQLRDSLLDSLRQEAIDSLRSQSRNGQYVIPTGSMEIILEDFGAEVDAEVASLELNLTIEVFAVSYNKEDILPLVNSVLESEIPDGYELSEDQPSILTDTTSNGIVDSSDIQVDLQISSTARPILAELVMKEAVSNKVLPEAVAVLKEFAGVSDANITINPNFVTWFSKSLPRSVDRIEIQIVSDKTRD